MRRDEMKFLKEERGSSLVLVGLAFMGLVLMTGLVLDAGVLYMEKRNLQKTANAAALSGAQELTTDEESVQKIVNDIVEYHEEKNSLEKTNIQLNDRLDVYMTKNVALTFSSLFGKDSTEVKVRAAAHLANMGKASGAAPLGIDDSVSLEYYKEYKLKVDQTESEQGYFGILALGGPGAATYEDNLRYGYQDSLKLGDVIDTQTGNIAGKTRQVIQEKMKDNCNYTPGGSIDRDCKRVLLIPVYKPYNHESGKQLKQVQVTGFAYFYITDPMSNKDKSITGMFIKRAGKGVYDEDAPNKGAFAIRLSR